MEEKEAFTRQAKLAMAYKRQFGKGYPNQSFWRDVAGAKEPHTKARMIYTALTRKDPETRKEWLDVFNRLKYISTRDVKRYLVKMIRDNPFEE